MRAIKTILPMSFLLVSGTAFANAGLEATAHSIEKLYVDSSIKLDCPPSDVGRCTLDTVIHGEKQHIVVDFSSMHAIPDFQVLQLRAGQDLSYYVVTTSVECTGADEALAPDAERAFCLLSFSVSDGKIQADASIQILPIYDQNLYRSVKNP